MKEIPASVKFGGAIAAATFIGGVAVGECVANNEKAPTFQIDEKNFPPPLVAAESTFNLPPIKCDPIDIINSINGTPQTEYTINVVSTYVTANDFYETANSKIVGSDGQLYLNGNPAGSAELAKKAKDHVTNGLCIVKSIPEFSDDFQVNGSLVNYKGIELDMDDSVDFQIVASLIKTALSYPLVDVSGLRDKDIEDLLKLKRLPFNLYIEDSSFPIVSTTDLIQISRMQQLMLDRNLPVVEEVFFKGYRKGDPGGGWYEEKLQGSASRITVTNYSDAEGTIPHEFGHHFAKVNDNAGNEKGMDNFGPRYVRLRESLGLATGFSTEHQTEGGFTINPNEEYAEAFKRYIEIQVQAPFDEKEQTILDFENNFFRRALEGEQFLNGIRLESIKPENIEIGEKYHLYKPTHDDSYQIFFNNGSVMMPVDFNISPYQELTVIDGPITVKDAAGNDEKVWKVQMTGDNAPEMFITDEFFVKYR